MIVQSAKADALTLDDRSEAFLASFSKTIPLMPAETFAANIAAVRARALEADKSPAAEFSRAWREVARRTYVFDRQAVEAEAISSVTQADLATFFADHVAPGGARRRKIVTMVSAGSRPSGGGAGPAGGAAEDADAEAPPAAEPGAAAAVAETPLAAPPLRGPTLSQADAYALLRESLRGPGAPAASRTPPFPVVEISDVDTFRSSLPLYPPSGAYARPPTASKL